MDYLADYKVQGGVLIRTGTLRELHPHQHPVLHPDPHQGVCYQSQEHTGSLQPRHAAVQGAEDQADSEKILFEGMLQQHSAKPVQDT